jgi:hypothetical protein
MTEFENEKKPNKYWRNANETSKAYPERETHESESHRLGCCTFSTVSEVAAKSAQLLGLRRVAISHQGTSDGNGGSATAGSYDDLGL